MKQQFENEARRENWFSKLVMTLTPKCMRPFVEKYWEVLTYLFFGVLTTLVNFVVYFMCKRLVGYLVANVIAWVFAVAFAFVTNKLYVFEENEAKGNALARQAASFVAARLFSLGLEEVILFVFVGLLHGNSNMFKIIGQVVVCLVNYIASKLFIFKAGRSPKNT